MPIGDKGKGIHDAYEVYLIQEIEDTSYFNILDLTDVHCHIATLMLQPSLIQIIRSIQLYYSGGACSSSYETYKRVFSDYPLRDYKFKLIRKIDYETWDKNGDDIPCTKYVYEVIDGKEILDEAMSGPED